MMFGIVRLMRLNIQNLDIANATSAFDPHIRAHQRRQLAKEMYAQQTLPGVFDDLHVIDAVQTTVSLIAKQLAATLVQTLQSRDRHCTPPLTNVSVRCSPVRRTRYFNSPCSVESSLVTSSDCT